MNISPLYHWSPRDRLASINKYGLLPRKRNVRGPIYHNEEDESEGEFLQTGICFSPTPATAWNYSHRVFNVPGTYDLWEVALAPEDEVRILPMWGDNIVEVRVFNRIKKSRLTWVGERVIT